MLLSPRSLSVASIAIVAILASSCSTQEPSVIDPLDPPLVDTLVVSPREASTSVDVPVTFSVPDTTVLGHPVSGSVMWTANGGRIDTSGVFVADSAGTYEVHFSAQHLSSGMYVYRLQAGDYMAAKKMILLR